MATAASEGYSRSLAALRERVQREQQRAEADAADVNNNVRKGHGSEDPRSPAEQRLPTSLQERLDAHRRAHSRDAQRAVAPQRRPPPGSEDVVASIVEAESREARANGAGSPFVETRDRLRLYIEAEEALAADGLRLGGDDDDAYSNGDPSSPPLELRSRRRPMAAAAVGRDPKRAASSSAPMTTPPPPSAAPSAAHSSRHGSPTRRARFNELLQEAERLQSLLASMEARHQEDEAGWRGQLEQERARTREAEERVAALEGSEERLLADVGRLEAALKTKEAQHDAAASSNKHASNADNNDESPANRAAQLRTKEIAHLRDMLERAEARAAAMEAEAADRDAIMRLQDEELRRAERAAEAAAAATTAVEDCAEEEIAQLRAELAAVSAQRDAANSRAAEAEAGLEAAQASLASLAASVASPARRTRRGSTNGRDSGRIDNHDAKEDGDHGDDSTADDDASPTAVEAVSKQLLADLETVRSKAVRLQSENAALQQRGATADGQLAALAARVAAVERERDAAQVSLEDALDHVDRLKSAHSRQQADFASAENTRAKEVSEARDALRDVEAQLEEQSEELRLKAVHCTTLEAQLVEAAKDLEKATATAAAAAAGADGQLAEKTAALAATKAELVAAIARAEDAERQRDDVSAQLDAAFRSLEEEQNRAMALERAAAENRDAHAAAQRDWKQQLAALQRRLSEQESAAAELAESLATATKQRDVALERCNLQKATAKSEVDTAVATGRSQIRQLAAMLTRREEELATLRERVAVLEAANHASAQVLAQQQDAIDRSAIDTVSGTSRSRRHDGHSQRAAATRSCVTPADGAADDEHPPRRTYPDDATSDASRAKRRPSSSAAPPPPPNAIRHGSSSVASSIAATQATTVAGSADSSVARLVRQGF